MKKRDVAFSKDLGSRIRLARLALNMSQDTVADRLDCARSNVSHMEVGRQTPTAVQVQALADLFGVRVDDLYPPTFSDIGVAVHPAPRARVKAKAS